MLAEAGYLKLNAANPITKNDLTDALKALGVEKGETLLVHSALSELGYIDGGVDSVIGSLRDAVGENGTVLAPAFTTPYIYFDGRVNKSIKYRPYDTRPNGLLRDKSIYTGILPRKMLTERDSARSGHSTHEWVVIGANAEKYISGHGFLDAPTGETSPLQNALKADGSVVFLGCGINSNTFIHYIETIAKAPYLQNAVISYIDENGKTCSAMINQHLPGHRSFYQRFEGDFYKEAIKRGLHIHEQELGLTTIYRIKLRELYDIGMEMFKNDPLATLCNNPDCTYCRKFR